MFGSETTSGLSRKRSSASASGTTKTSDCKIAVEQKAMSRDVSEASMPTRDLNPWRSSSTREISAMGVLQTYEASSVSSSKDSSGSVSRIAYLSRAMTRASSLAGLVMTISKLLRETFVPCMPPGGESYSKLKNMARQGSSCESGPASRTGTDPSERKTQAGGEHRESHNRLSGNRAQRCGGFRSSVSRGARGGVVEEVSPEISGIDGGKRRSGRLIRHSGRFFRRHLSVSRWLASGSLGAAASLPDFSCGGHRWLLHLSFKSGMALPLPRLGVRHGLAGHGISGDVCDDRRRATEGTKSDGLHSSIDAEAHLHGDLAADRRGDDWHTRFAKRRSSGTSRHRRTGGICRRAAFLTPAPGRALRRGEDERSLEIVSTHPEKAASL